MAGVVGFGTTVHGTKTAALPLALHPRLGLDTDWPRLSKPFEALTRRSGGTVSRQDARRPGNHR